MFHSLLKYIAAAIIAGFTAQEAAAQLETPQPSPKGKIEQKVGVMNVSVSYSRPGVKGRKIFGDLVPFGQEWRTGANEPTTITFSDPVKIEGQDLPAGTYSLYSIPQEQEWTVILNKKTSGPPRDTKEDAITLKIQPSRTANLVETFTINITDITTNAANLELAWENTVVKFRMEFDVDTKVMAAIKRTMENPLAAAANNYYQSASYYYSTNRELKTALEWVDKSLDINKNPYWVWRLKSQIQAALKDYKGAIVSAEMSKERAKAAGNEQFVKINEAAIAEWKGMK
ncbi:MAG: DUF2911 domain-containing protein [Bacteroidetes bacterium]|nr:DUF2911 domain-containing protein [Bacteroidota bacterium]MCW5896188.1 DUF2911 domain-containing protein [Bacteroidota bacterium]